MRESPAARIAQLEARKAEIEAQLGDSNAGTPAVQMATLPGGAGYTPQPGGIPLHHPSLMGGVTPQTARTGGGAAAQNTYIPVSAVSPKLSASNPNHRGSTSNAAWHAKSYFDADPIQAHKAALLLGAAKNVMLQQGITHPTEADYLRTLRSSEKYTNQWQNPQNPLANALRHINDVTGVIPDGIEKTYNDIVNNMGVPVIGGLIGYEKDHISVGYINAILDKDQEPAIKQARQARNAALGIPFMPGSTTAAGTANMPGKRGIPLPVNTTPEEVQAVNDMTAELMRQGVSLQDQEKILEEVARSKKDLNRQQNQATSAVDSASRGAIRQAQNEVNSAGRARQQEGRDDAITGAAYGAFAAGIFGIMLCIALGPIGFGVWLAMTVSGGGIGAAVGNETGTRKSAEELAAEGALSDLKSSDMQTKQDIIEQYKDKSLDKIRALQEAAVVRQQQASAAAMAASNMRPEGEGPVPDINREFAEEVINKLGAQNVVPGAQEQIEGLLKASKADISVLNDSGRQTLLDRTVITANALQAKNAKIRPEQIDKSVVEGLRYMQLDESRGGCGIPDIVKPDNAITNDARFNLTRQEDTKLGSYITKLNADHERARAAAAANAARNAATVERE